MSAEDGFWVFGYGSLLWRPGFEALERRKARLDGYARDFRLASWRYRGTEAAPGLVLALDWEPGASCTGIAFRVCGSRAREVRAYLHTREMVNRSYHELTCPVTLLCEGPGEGEQIDALTYVVDRTHRQYAGRLALEEQAAIIARAEGPAGPNDAYLHNTVAHLREVGLEDPHLEALDARVRALKGG